MPEKRYIDLDEATKLLTDIRENKSICKSEDCYSAFIYAIEQLKLLNYKTHIPDDNMVLCQDCVFYEETNAVFNKGYGYCGIDKYHLVPKGDCDYCSRSVKKMNEKRYIDANILPDLFAEEYRKTWKLIKEGETHLNNLAEGFTEAHDVISRVPTEDVIPVVRCVECRWYRLGWCSKIGQLRSKDDFCSYGERKE